MNLTPETVTYIPHHIQFGRCHASGHARAWAMREAGAALWVPQSELPPIPSSSKTLNSTFLCTRFGGVCSALNQACRVMRYSHPPVDSPLPPQQP